MIKPPTRDELISAVFAANTDNFRLEEALEKVTKERDEARREVCEFERVNMKQAHEYATYRGWDCFKEETQ